MEDQEIWKDIPGWEGQYRCSNTGHIYSMLTRQQLKPITTKKGYFYIVLHGKPPFIKRYVHRLVMLTFEGPPPNNLTQVMHLDDNPSNNSLSNLKYGSASDNQTDRWAKRRFVDVTVAGLIRRAKSIQKPVYKFDLTGKLIAQYEGIQAACRICNLNSASVAYALKNKTQAKGYYWSYTEKCPPLKNSWDMRVQQKIIQLTPDGKIINEFSNLQQAMNITGIDNIANVCKGRRLKAGGFSWQYATGTAELH